MNILNEAYMPNKYILVLKLEKQEIFLKRSSKSLGIHSRISMEIILLFMYYNFLSI